MATYLGKSCSFGFPRVPFVNCRQFMYLVISLLVLRAVTRHGGDDAEVKTRHLRPAVSPQRYRRPWTLVHGSTLHHFYLAKGRRVELAC